MAFRMWEADKRYRTCGEHSNTAFAARDRSVSRINSTPHKIMGGGREEEGEGNTQKSRTKGKGKSRPGQLVRVRASNPLFQCFLGPNRLRGIRETHVSETSR